MTNNILDSKSVNYDRRSALLGAAVIPLAAVPLFPSAGVAGENDIAIKKMVSTYAHLSSSLDAIDDLSDEVLEATMDVSNAACDALHETPANSVLGIREKIKYLRRPENWNGGYFSEDSLNLRVLESLFSDIERLAEGLS